MNAPRTARARARAELTATIKDVARRHLAAEGTAGLSLRAVARELEMSSSAVYRYFASRDELLTALITDAYDSLGAAAERADARHRPADDVTGRWMALCRAVRRWAREHPQEYALVYGSPIPGYAAPDDTVGPATRVPAVLSALVRQGLSEGALVPATGAEAEVDAALQPDVEALRSQMFAGVPDDVVIRSLTAWSGLFGVVSFELFGHYDGVIDHREAWFDAACRHLARLVGFRA